MVAEFRCDEPAQRQRTKMGTKFRGDAVLEFRWRDAKLVFFPSAFCRDCFFFARLHILQTTSTTSGSIKPSWSLAKSVSTKPYYPALGRKHVY